jgi:hypothetical protein
MERPQVADGEDVLLIWRVAENILNKHSRTDDKGWSYSLGVGQGANNSSPYKTSFLNNVNTQRRNWTDSLELPRQPEMNMRFENGLLGNTVGGSGLDSSGSG